jgi:Holliday junction resolvase RusA-like endonuclease
MWKDLVWIEARLSKPDQPLERAHVSCTRFSGSQRPDETNLRSSFKPLIDALVNVGIMVDDDTKHMSEEYDWQPSPGGEGRVVIEVTEVGER